jgi:hypothetical protein
MEISALPYGLAVWLPVPAALDAGEGAQKNFCAENPHNPLKSHDSDERIQGNPRKSNRRKAGLSRRKRFIPRKPKQIGKGAARDVST